MVILLVLVHPRFLRNATVGDEGGEYQGRWVCQFYY